MMRNKGTQIIHEDKANQYSLNLNFKEVRAKEMAHFCLFSHFGPFIFF